MSAIRLISIFSAFFIAFCAAEVAKSHSTSSSTAESKTGRSYTSGGGAVDPNNYMNQIFAHKPPIDLLHVVIPILLVLAFIPLVLPLVFQLFAGVFQPVNFAHGKRKRETNFHPNPQISELLLNLMTKVGDSLDKYIN